MAANVSPIFSLTGSTTTTTITGVNTPNTARDGSGTLFTIFTAGANGSMVESITFRSAQTSANVGACAQQTVRVWITDTSGNNPRFLCEGTLQAVTASNTAIGSVLSFNFLLGQVILGSTVLAGNTTLIDITSPVALASGQLLKATQAVNSGTGVDDVQVTVKATNF